jgi:CBS domain-containing membrane protein
MAKVHEVMTPSPLMIQADASLFDARRVMHEHHVRHLPVCNEKGELVGLLTQRDLLACTVSVLAEVDQQSQNELEQGIPVREVMTTNIACVQQHSSVIEAADYFLEHNHSCLPVLDGEELVGILTEVDFIKLSKRLLEQ